MTIIMGDLNAKIGRKKYTDINGLEARNERGDRLKDFKEEEEFVILNTFFELPLRRLCTWISPQDRPGNVVRNQIDYMLVNKRFRNSCLSVKTYPGADISSDHHPLAGRFRIKLKKVKKKPPRRRWDMKKLKEKETKEHVKKLLAEECERLDMTNNTKETLKKITKTFNAHGDEHLVAKNEQRKGWMTNNILQLMEKRRKMKNNETKNIQRQIRREIKIAKEN